MQTISIGRDASNNIILNDIKVSRYHAHLIILDDSRVIIKDLGSTNGTYVNGNRITEHYLNYNDAVRCADVNLDWHPYVSSTNRPSREYSPEVKTPPYQRPDQNLHQDEKKLYISSSIADNLPAMVRNELANLSAQKQEEFIEEYKRKRKSLGVAYLLLIIVLGLHYGYLKKWGFQLVFWLTLFGFGIWWFIDLFRLPGMVRNYNKDIAVEVIRNLKAISHP